MVLPMFDPPRVVKAFGSRVRRRSVSGLALIGVVVALGAREATAQSLVEVLSTTYNGNPDLLAGRALLR